MKIFERDGKINFVDENNVFVGFDWRQQCCEDFGWFISDKIEEKALKSKGDYGDLSGWLFDLSFFDEKDDMVVFRLTKADKQKFLHLYNHHYGYYYHKFEFLRDGTLLKSDSI